MLKGFPFKSSSGRWSRFLEESSFIRHYLWKYRRWVGIGLLALVIVDAVEVLPSYFLAKEVIDVIVDQRPIHRLAWMAGAYLATCLLQGVCRYGWRMFLDSGQYFYWPWSSRKICPSPFQPFCEFFWLVSNGLMSLATSDVETVSFAIGTGLLVFADALFYLLTIPVAMFLLSPNSLLSSFVCRFLLYLSLF